MRSRIDGWIGKASRLARDTQRTSLDSSLGRGSPPVGRARKQDRELLTYLAVAELDHVVRVGIDADDAGDLDVDAGFFLGLPYGGLGDVLPESPARHRAAPRGPLSVRWMSRTWSWSSSTKAVTATTMLFAFGALGSLKCSSRATAPACH